MSELKDKFSGINLTQQEGSREVINLRPKKDGTYHVVGKKKPMTPTIQGIKAVHKHPTYPGVIAYVESEQGEKTIKQVTGTFSKTLIVLDTEEEFYSMGHYGNILIVCTSVTKYHILWRDDKYEVLPQLKNMKLSVATTEEEYLEEVSGWFNDPKITIGNYREVVYNKLKEGRVEGMMMARAAMRLYSGEYIMYSYPIFIRVGEEIQDVEFPLMMHIDPWSHQLLRIKHLKTAKLKFQIEAQTDLYMYKDIITSIDVFITKPRTAYLIDEEKKLEEYPVEYNPFPLDESNVDDTKNDGTYYLIKTVSPDQFVQGKYSFGTDADTFKAIETKTTLPIDENTNHTVTSKKQFLYNDTNIFIDNTIIFSNGYENTLKHNNDNLMFWRTYMNDIQLRTSIPTNQYFWQFEGTYDRQPITVTKNIDLTLSMFMPSFQVQVMFFILNKYITYPALGFNKATLYCKLPNGEYKICIIIPLKNHQTLNLSIGTTQNDFIYEFSFNEPFLLTERSFLGNSRNTIRATGTGTPFVLPTPRVYSFGENNTIVLAVSTLQSDISTGQYGLYPLYVFTTGGMFLLSVGHGHVLFDRVSYMNDYRLVGEPLNVLNSVVFYNGSDIYMLTGNEIRTISDDIKGVWRANELLEDGSYREFLGSSDLVDVWDVLTVNDSLSAYMQDAVMVYDDAEKELIISNEAFGFSFVYSQFNTWHKITDTFRIAFNNYDSWMILSDDQLLSLKEEPGYLKVLLQVNPVKLTSSYFKVRSVRLNCDVINYVGDNEQRGNEFALYIFASVNDQLFKLLNGTQSNNERISRLTLNKSSLRASVKQIITLIAGKLKTGSRIDSIVYAVEEKKSRRLK